MERTLPDETEWKGVPYVGCAATIPAGSDSYPGTVVWVSDQTVEHEYKDRKTGKSFKVLLPKRIRIREVQYRGLKGHNNAYTEDQRYVYYETDEDVKNDAGREYSWRPKRQNYVAVGDRYHGTQSPHFGYRRAYRDPCF